MLEAEVDSLVIRRLDGLDYGVLPLAWARAPGPGVDDVVVARLDVSRRERRAVVELDPAADLERVGQAVLGRRPALGEVADDARAGRIGRIDAQQCVVVRADRMHEPEGLLAVAVIARHLRPDH